MATLLIYNTLPTVLLRVSVSSLPNARSDCSLKLGRGSSQVLSFQTDLMITTHGEGMAVVWGSILQGL